MAKVRFDVNTRMWIGDRVSNGEPLFWKEFIEFMDESLDVGEKKIKTYKTKSYKNAAKREYAKHKKKFRGGMGSFSY